MTTGDGLDHYVEVPRYMVIVRFVQASLSVLLLGLVCYPTHIYTTAISNAPDALAFNIFTPVWTFIVLAYALIVPLKYPKCWNKWASLGLEVVTWVFWLTAFAIMADFVRKSSVFGKTNYVNFIYKRSAVPQSLGDFDIGELIDGISSGGSFSSGGSSGGSRGSSFKSGVTPWWALCAVSTAVGAIGWVLWTFTLYTFVVALKNQSNNGTVNPGQSTEKYGKTGDVELNQQTFSSAPQQD
jgi:hypothetical protein